MMQEIALRLREVPLFDGIGAAALEELAARAIPRALARGALLFRKGETCEGLHVVLEGRLKVYCTTASGREQVLHRVGAGEVVTELPLFDGGPYPASARAMVDSTVLFLPREAVERLRREHPELVRAAVRDLGRGIRRLMDVVEKVTLKDTRARVATALLERASASDALRDGGAFELGLTQEELARALAVTRESVARSLSDLRRTNVVAQRGSHVRIVSVTALAAAADGPVEELAGARARMKRLGAYKVVVQGPCC